MDALLPHLRERFLDRREHFVAFSKADARVEGWFKGELLVLLSKLADKGQIDHFQAEVNRSSPQDGKRKQVAFVVGLHGEEHLCELKALSISRSKTQRSLRFYFGSSPPVMRKDFAKLDSIDGSNKWVLAFVYPSPTPAEVRPDHFR